MRRFLRNNGLCLSLMALFLASFVGQVATGLRVYDSDRETHGKSAVGLGAYLTSGHFLEATFENWESEFLQMAAFVLLTVKLYQKGSPESNDPDDPDADERKPKPPFERHPWAVRRGGWVKRLYSTSLSGALLLLFVGSFALHAVGGAREYSEEQVEHGEPPVTALAFVGTSEFWFQSFQNWQSEFLSVAAVVFLAVWLRQKGSPESKRLESAHHDHD